MRYSVHRRMKHEAMIQREEDGRDAAARDATSGTFLTLTSSSTVLSERAALEHQAHQFGALVRGMAHQLSSPLGALLTNISLAQEGLQQALAQRPETQDAGLLHVKTCLEDLDDALALVRRLGGIAETMKRWGRTSSVEELDMRDVLALIANAANSLSGQGSKVTYQFESPQTSSGARPDSAAPWLVRTRFIPLACSVMDIITAYGVIAPPSSSFSPHSGQSPQSAHSPHSGPQPESGVRPICQHTIRLIAQALDQCVRLAVEVRSIGHEPPLTLSQSELSSITQRLAHTNITLHTEASASSQERIVLVMSRP